MPDTILIFICIKLFNFPKKKSTKMYAIDKNGSTKFGNL